MSQVRQVRLDPSSSIPRRLVPGPALGRALAARQMVGQAAGVIGAPLGGVIVAMVGLRGATAANSVTFAVMFVVLLGLRRGHAAQPAPSAETSLAARTLDGLRICAHDPVLRALLAIGIAAAGCLLPLTSLLIPLLARNHHWPAAVAGQIVGAQALGAGVVVLFVVWRNTSRRPGVALSAGLLAAGVAVLLLAAAPTPTSASVCAVGVGVGLGVFGSHAGPLFLSVTPKTHLSRAQAVLVLAHALPVLVAVNVLGALAARVAVPTLVTVCGAVTIAAALSGVANGAVRAATPGG